MLLASKPEAAPTFETQPPTPSASSECSDECGPSPAPSNGSSDSNQADDGPVKCSAVSSIERDMPTFDYSDLLREFRQNFLDFAAANVGLFNAVDVERCKHDDWFVARYLLRFKLNTAEAMDCLKASLRFRNENLVAFMAAEDFPAEFYQVAGMFKYERDRKNNVVLYIRVRAHRKMPELAAILQAFIYFLLLSADEEAHGKGIAIVIDCSGAGLANADLDTLFFFVHTLKHYYPKGLSYMLVHELPFLLRPIWHIAKVWVPSEHASLIKFSDARTIREYIDADKLPDFLGGSCRRPYADAPPNCVKLLEAAKLWGVDAKSAIKILERYADCLPASVLADARREAAEYAGEGAA